MTYGVTADISELIALKCHARTLRYQPEHCASRAGNLLSKQRGRGMDFAEVRNYQAGDEIRHMEWRMTARTGKPHIKLYQEERERPVVLITDFNASMYFGTCEAFKSVIAARLSAILAWTAVKQGDWVGGVFFSASKHNEYTPRARETGVLTLLASLSEYTHEQVRQQTQKNALAHALLRVSRVTKPGSVLVLISDFYQFNEECCQLLTRLKGHNDILAYHICDPLELSPPKPQRYAITNGQEALLLDTTNPHVVRAYQQYCSERITSLDQQLTRLQIKRIPVTGADDLARLVVDTFPRRKNA